MTFPRADLLNRRFGRLKVVAYAGSFVQSGRHKRTKWVCRCDCGKEVEVWGSYLTGAKGKRSCGCLAEETRSLNGLNTSASRRGEAKWVGN